MIHAMRVPMLGLGGRYMCFKKPAGGTGAGAQYAGGPMQQQYPGGPMQPQQARPYTTCTYYIS
jgi:hypothetical protein